MTTADIIVALQERKEKDLLKHTHKSSLIESLEELLTYDSELTEEGFGGSWGYSINPHYSKEIRLLALEWLPTIENDIERVAHLLEKSWRVIEFDKGLKEAVLGGLVESFVRGSKKALVYLANRDGNDGFCYGLCGKERTYKYFVNPQIQKFIRDALMRIPDNEKLFVLLNSNYSKVITHLDQTTKPEDRRLSAIDTDELRRRVSDVSLPKEQAWWILPTRLYPNLKEGDYIGFNPLNLAYSHKCDDLYLQYPIGFTDFPEPVNSFGIVEEIMPFERGQLEQLYNPGQTDRPALIGWFLRKKEIDRLEKGYEQLSDYPKDLPIISIGYNSICVNCDQVWLDINGKPDFNHCPPMLDTVETFKNLQDHQCEKLLRLMDEGVKCPFYHPKSR